VQVTVTAFRGSTTLPRQVTVSPTPPPGGVQVAALSVSPSSVTAGKAATATVPATVTVAAGATSAVSTVTTTVDTGQVYTQTAGIRASYAGSSAAAVLFVFPPSPPRVSRCGR
jgi:hypothetical protein